MSTFRHHPDGIIYIDEKSIPLSLFLEQEPSYVFPDGYRYREYIQGVRHFMITNSCAQVGGQFPWEAGDNFISKKDLYYTTPQN